MYTLLKIDVLLAGADPVLGEGHFVCSPSIKIARIES